MSVLEDTGSLYIDHCSVENGKAITIGQELIDVINNSDSRESLRAVCSDGTNVNVGKDGGVIRYFELNVGRPLQRMICLFHFNELPFRHLFEFYFGKTTGPRTFGDEFGNKIIQDLTKLPIVNYSPISGSSIENLTEQVIRELTNDQKYLYNISKAIENDPKCFPISLVDLNPGTINHARWLTRANRILRL